MNQKALNELADDILSCIEWYNSNAPYLARMNASLGRTYSRGIANNQTLREISELVRTANKPKLLKLLEKYNKALKRMYDCKNPNLDNLQNTGRYSTFIEKALKLM